MNNLPDYLVFAVLGIAGFLCVGGMLASVWIEKNGNEFRIGGAE